MEKPKIKIEDCTWKETSKHEGFHVAVIPWGSCEPHGEQLSYCTDTILAENIAYEVVSRTDNPSTFMILPSIPFGSQNRGQTDKKYCIHLSTETQKSLLRDIVSSLDKQYVAKLVIVNGHNGNNFKSIIRDLELEYDVDIYVCNYLDIADKNFMKTIEGYEDVDDHAGFSETSMMLYWFNGTQYVNMSNLNMQDKDLYGKQKQETSLWTPRDWNAYSCNTRVGNPRNATEEAGKIITEHIIDTMVKDFNKIIKFEY